MSDTNNLADLAKVASIETAGDPEVKRENDSTTPVAVVKKEESETFKAVKSVADKAEDADQPSDGGSKNASPTNKAAVNDETSKIGKSPDPDPIETTTNGVKDENEIPIGDKAEGSVGKPAKTETESVAGDEAVK